MASEFKSKAGIVNAPVEMVYARLSNPENLRTLLDNIPADRIPADKLEQLKNVRITADSITLPGGPTGSVTLRLDHCEAPSLVRLKAADLPVSLIMELHLKEADSHTTEAQAVIVADIPMMLRPMVKGPLQQVADKVIELIAGIPFAD